MAYRTYSITNGFIVAADGTGDFLTINAAYSAASAGIVIGVKPSATNYPASYTIKPGVILCAMPGSGEGKTVILSGQGTFSGGQNAVIANITLQSNSSYAVVFNGSSSGNLILDQCYLDAIGFNCLSHVSSSNNAEFKLRRCTGDLSGNVNFFDVACGDNMRIQYCEFQNSFGSTATNTISSGTVFADYSIFRNPITTSGSGQLVHDACTFNCGSINTTALTFNSPSVENNGRYSSVIGGTAPAVNININSIYQARVVEITSDNVYSISGSGNLQYGIIGSVSSTLTFDPGLSISFLNLRMGKLILGTPLLTPSGGTGLSAPGASGNVLTSNGTIWISAAGGAAGGGGSIIDIAVNTAASANVSYNATAALTVTLPASPSQSDTIQIICSHAGPIVIQANTGQTIKLGANNSTSAGTATNTQIGDTVTLRYLSVSSSWRIVSSIGSWNMA